MAATITTIPCPESSLEISPKRRTFLSRSALEKPESPSSERISSPSRISTRYPRSCSSGLRVLASVVLPEPDRPVNHKVKPLDVDFERPLRSAIDSVQLE